MIKIALLSDTHGHLDEDILDICSGCDEIWHAGDIGTMDVLEQLEGLKPVRAVYGNIDNHQIRRAAPLNLSFELEGVKVFMTHIGGYPGRYTKRVRDLLNQDPPDLYICGHSHILKVMPDKKLNLLHINSGACGHHGFHHIRTMVRFNLNNGKIEGLEAIEFGKRGRK